MIKNIYITLLVVTAFVACDKYLDIEPIGKVIPKSVKEYRGFLTKGYAIASKNNHSILSTYRADELNLISTLQGIEQYEDIFIWNDESPDPRVRKFPYVGFYTVLFYTNHLINSNEKIEGKTTEKKQLLGEAYALRALQYFELINLYAKPYDKTTAKTDPGVPIVTKYNVEQKFTRKSVQEVYDLIISDIEQAEKYIVLNKQKTGYNYRFSLVAIKSLKSRVYLYLKEWQKVAEATKEALAIQSALVNLNTDTSKMPSEYNSKESILALNEVSSYELANGSTISDNLLNTYDKTNDLRFALYFNKNEDGGYLSKKNADPKYKCTFRTSELYLNLAEAYTKLNKIELAKTELLKLAKNRYTLVKYNKYKAEIGKMNKTELYNEILEERKRELAIEGHRWNDLRRTTQPKITKQYKQKTYVLNKNDNRYVIPFPKDAVINNPDLQK